MVIISIIEMTHNPSVVPSGGARSEFFPASRPGRRFLALKSKNAAATIWRLLDGISS